jgi:hypothetical protein
VDDRQCGHECIASMPLSAAAFGAYAPPLVMISPSPDLIRNQYSGLANLQQYNSNPTRNAAP